jgi:antitoxin component HigA of HigAB toxin-antitoxin module
MNPKTLDFLNAHASETPSRWREEAEWRRANASWLRHSQEIAVKVLLKMKELHLTQKALAERMNCTQQYVSKILKGQENLSLDTITRLEIALQIRIVLAESTQSNEEVTMA